MNESQRKQARLDAYRARVEAEISRLPPVARDLVARWRPWIEQLGRVGPSGCGLDALAAFVQDLGAAFDAQWDAFLAGSPSAGRPEGSGF